MILAETLYMAKYYIDKDINSQATQCTSHRMHKYHSVQAMQCTIQTVHNPNSAQVTQCTSLRVRAQAMQWTSHTVHNLHNAWCRWLAPGQLVQGSVSVSPAQGPEPR